jgi:hypothetical protein
MLYDISIVSNVPEKQRRIAIFSLTLVSPKPNLSSYNEISNKLKGNWKSGGLILRFTRKSTRKFIFIPFLGSSFYSKNISIHIILCPPLFLV